MFQLSGSKWLLRQFLRLPLTPTSRAAQPAWHHLLSGFEEHKTSSEYLKAVENCQRQGEDHVRLSHRLWSARHNHEQGKNISFKIRADLVEFASLSQNDQSLAEDYEGGRSGASLDALMKEKEESGTTNFHLLRMNPML